MIWKDVKNHVAFIWGRAGRAEERYSKQEVMNGLLRVTFQSTIQPCSYAGEAFSLRNVVIFECRRQSST